VTRSWRTGSRQGRQKAEQFDWFPIIGEWRSLIGDSDGEGMNDRLLRAYHRLPVGRARSSHYAWGLYLRSWRYSADTEQLAAAIEREHWSRSRWRAFQEERLVSTRRTTEVPFYREQWGRGAAPAIDRPGAPELADSREGCRSRQPAGVRRRLSYPADVSRHHQHVGHPIVVYRSRTELRAWYALAEHAGARVRRLS
jgi:hypothetical protein